MNYAVMENMITMSIEGFLVSELPPPTHLSGNSSSGGGRSYFPLKTLALETVLPSIFQ